MFFLRFIFTIYNMMIERKTKGFRGLNRITRGYRGLQRVPGDYRGLQRITETRFQTRISLASFLGLFFIKIKVEEISNFRTKKLTNPFGKILILRFS